MRLVDLDSIALGEHGPEIKRWLAIVGPVGRQDPTWDAALRISATHTGGVSGGRSYSGGPVSGLDQLGLSA